MSAATQSTSRNLLLASLSPDAIAPLLPHLSAVPLRLREVLYEAGGPIKHVYFPLSGMVSIVNNLEDGMQAEVGIVGREGVLGASLLMEVDTSFCETFVQLPGEALRMAAADFERAIATSAVFRRLLGRYVEAFQAQVMQTAACNGRHGLEQRLARWLLMAHDRGDGAELPLTQDFIAMMLGVHRPSITITAGILQRAGMIRYAKGLVTVTDRESLEASSCECYFTVKRRFETLICGPV